MNPKQFVNEIVNPANILLLNRPEFEFFGILLMMFDFKIFDTEEYAALTTYDNIFITSSFNKINWTYRSFMFVVIHELMHIIQDTRGRRGTRDQVLWNIASDACINYMLDEYVQVNKLEWPISAKTGKRYGILFPDIVNKDNPDITVEEVYDILLKKEKTEYEIIGVKELIIGDYIEACERPEEDNEKEINDNQDKENDEIDDVNEGFDTTDENGNKWTFEKLFQKMNDEWKDKNIIVRIRNTATKEIFDVLLNNEPKNCNSSHSDVVRDRASVIFNSSGMDAGRELMPGSLTTLLKELFHVEIPWNKIYEKSILYYSQCMTNRSWVNKNIYYPRIRVPGKRSGGSDTDTAIFVIDSSASVSDLDLNKFVSVCCDSVNYYGKIVILVHDTEVVQTFVFDHKPDPLSMFSSIKEIQGRGGTSHIDAFNKIEELYQTSQISVVSFLTDFGSDVMSIFEQYEWVKVIPSIWILNCAHPNIKLKNADTTTIIIN